MRPMTHRQRRLAALHKTLDSRFRPAIIAVFAARHTLDSKRHLAQVAELVDAPGSGPGGGNTVEVRVLSWAPDLKGRLYAGLFHFSACDEDNCPTIAQSEAVIFLG